MKKILAFIIITFSFNTFSTTSVKAVNPIIAIEGIGLGLQILEKGIDKIGGGKKSKPYSSNNSN